MSIERHNHIIVVTGTAAELADRTLKHWEMGVATDTGEARMGPGLWANIAPANATVDTRVRLATAAALTLATGLNAGDTVDGVVLVAGDLVLVKNQAAPAENGVYVAGPSPARAAAYDTYNEHSLKLILAEEGTANANKVFRCTSAAGGTINVTAIDFVEYPKTSLAALSQVAALPAGTTSEAGTGLLLLERANGTTVKLSLTNLKASLAALP